MEILYRDKIKLRCDHCRMRQDLCVCAAIPRFDLRTRLVLVMHEKESHKPSNTGRLAHLCLSNSELRLRGVVGEELDYSTLVPAGTEPVLLFPDKESKVLGPEFLSTLSPDRPVTFIVPDGNWGQASRTAARILKNIPATKVKLPPDAPTAYHLRREVHEEGLATFEAIARALGIIEGHFSGAARGAEVRRRMEAVFHMMVERQLNARGRQHLWVGASSH